MNNPVLKIKGGRPLNGSLKVQGSKNAALPVMAASVLLGQGESLMLSNVPHLKDTETLVELLREMGMTASFEAGGLVLTAGGALGHELPDHLVRKMRASSLILGPLLAREGKAVMPLPGGCSIGARPLDLHLKGLAKMGAEVEIQQGAVQAKAKKLQGARIYLDFPSVGATENLLMAAALAQGTTVIENAAREPEIVNLAQALEAMGVSVHGAGSSLIEVQGKGEPLRSGALRVIPDRIAACTYLLAGVITDGEVTVEDVIPEHFDALLAKLEEGGVRFLREPSSVKVFPSRENLKALSVQTLPYPGFPTDVQPQLLATLTLAQGTSTLRESIFENRFMHVPELARMGAEIEIQGGNTALINGVKKLTGCHVKATDLRAGAALTMAGMAAEGVTHVHGLNHILRGYEGFESLLTSLGAEVEIVDLPDEA